MVRDMEESENEGWVNLEIECCVDIPLFGR